MKSSVRNTLPRISLAAACGIAAALPLLAGCCTGDCAARYKSPGIAPLGAQSDAIWQRQEANAEASDYVVYQHEFEMNGVRLNTDGEDHIRQIAARLRCHADMPVVVERSMTKVRPQTEFKYPVHPDPELDMQRRDVIVRLLLAMGIADAEQRVMVAPALAEGQNATEAGRSYYQGLNRGGYGSGNSGFGGAWFGGASGGAGFGGITP